MALFGGVTEQVDRVVIVATGPSIEHVGQVHVENVDAYPILVNRALKYFDPPHPGAWFTLDPGPKNRALLAENEGRRRPLLHYYMAVPDDYGHPRAALPAHRQPAEAGVTFLRRRTGHGPHRHLSGLSETTDGIHTGNSAYGALGAAYLMRPKKIALLGVDGVGGYAFEDGAPVDLSHIAEMFASAVRQLKARGIEVVNGSPHSVVDCFPRMEPQDALDWVGRP